MGTILANPHEVDAPPIGARRYGLFDVVTTRTMSNRVIAAGLQFVVDHCGGDAAVYDQTCVASPVKSFREGSDVMVADPFWLVARKRCGTVGRTAEDMLRAVREQLGTMEQRLVEDVFWDGGGLVGHTPTLTGAGATVVVPTAAGAGAAISALENAFYQVSGYAGVIHVNTRAEGALKYAGMLDRREAGVWKTPINTSVSIGAGYDITGPAGVAPAAGFVWAFITSPVTMWRSGVLDQPPPRQTLDRTLNQWDVVAEEVFALTYDCPEVFAVQVPIAAPATAATPAPV